MKPTAISLHRMLPLLAALSFAPSALAQGWLAGGSLGPATQYEYSVGGPIRTFDNDDAGFRAFGGYLITPKQGVVASFVDLGTPYYDGPAFGGFTDHLSAEGLDISWLIGFSPGAQERITLFSTVGMFRWTQDVHYVDASGVYDYKDEGTSLSFGLGSEINLGGGDGSAWGFHYEWQWFRNVGDKNNSGHEYDRKMLSVGVDYRFGR